MRLHHQRLVRMARLHAEGKGRDDICDELGITRSTYYRDRGSDAYREIVDGLTQVVIPSDHPDIVEARDIHARSRRELAEVVSGGMYKAALELVARIEDADNMSTRDLIAAFKALSDEVHRIAPVDGEDEEDRPLTDEEIAAVARLAGVA